MLTKPFEPDEYYSVSQIVKWLGMTKDVASSQVGAYFNQHLDTEDEFDRIWEGGSKGRWTYKGEILNEFFAHHEVRKCEAMFGGVPCGREHLGEIRTPPECSWHKGVFQKQRRVLAKEEGRNRMQIGTFSFCPLCKEIHPYSSNDERLYKLYGQCEATLMEESKA